MGGTCTIIGHSFVGWILVLAMRAFTKKLTKKAKITAGIVAHAPVWKVWKGLNQTWRQGQASFIFPSLCSSSTVSARWTDKHRPRELPRDSIKSISGAYSASKRIWIRISPSVSEATEGLNVSRWSRKMITALVLVISSQNLMRILA